jgi:hypothetical protein|tara:strand:+ start:114 stop:323 length:210 start_codon:yes stop_codon:yes gene_type:complete
MEDDKLSKIAYEIDDVISEFISKYNIDPLSFSAIILARLVRANDFIGTGEDFRLIAANIPKIKSEGAIH